MIAGGMILLVIGIAFVADVLGSEFYLFLPSLRRFRPLPTPPTPAWSVPVIYAVCVGIFFLSRRFAAVMIAGVSAMFFLGLPVGTVIFEWTPGVAQYLLILTSGAVAIFVWAHEDLHED
jgi:hypothetical protein